MFVGVRSMVRLEKSKAANAKVAEEMDKRLAKARTVPFVLHVCMGGSVEYDNAV